MLCAAYPSTAPYPLPGCCNTAAIVVPPNVCKPPFLFHFEHAVSAPHVYIIYYNTRLMTAHFVYAITCALYFIHLLQFASAFSITMLFPFLPFMVEFLLPQIDVSSVGKQNRALKHVFLKLSTGKYAGMIASAMFLGRFFGR